MTYVSVCEPMYGAVSLRGLWGLYAVEEGRQFEADYLRSCL
jgi:hypothetical protein